MAGPAAGGGVARWVDRAVVTLAVMTGAAIVAFVAGAGDYYLLPLWERPEAALHRALRPSGALGHLLGIVGAAMVITGVMLYSSRKRLAVLRGRGPMRTWLNVHIYLCLTGPVLVTLHTALKLRGLGVYSFWSMWIVAASGIAGRWLYQQFPRTIRGTEMSLADVRADQERTRARLREEFHLAPAALAELEAHAEAGIARIRRHAGPLALPLLALDDAMRPWRTRALRRRLHLALPAADAQEALRLAARQIMMQRRIAFLGLFKRVFLYWHITHLIFFFAMFGLLVLHIGVALFFGAGIGGG